MTSWLVLALLACLGRYIGGELTEATEVAASSANAEFTFDLLRKLNTEGSNVFYSPFSISAAVAMTSLGATGNTLDEIDHAFHFSEVKNTSSDPNALHEVFKKTLTLYEQTNSNYSMSAANRLFAQQGFDIKQQFKNDTRDYYKAEIEQLVFGDGEAEGIINSWVEQQTNNKITQLFTPNSLTSDTVLALVSAIYFKGSWQIKFDKQDTLDMEFYTTPDKHKTIKLMSITENFKYYKDQAKNVQILELLYSGKDISMIIILPQQGQLQQLISETDSSTLHSLLGKLRRRKVNVKIPKFKLETEYALKPTLQQLGVNDLFTDRANLTEISETPTKISRVVHKAFVEVDEEGTEAAAATGIVAVPMSSHYRPPETPSFIADHPFLFALVDKRENNNVLFLGTVVEP